MRILVYHDVSDSAFWAVHEEWPGILQSDPSCVIVEEGEPHFDEMAMKAGAMRMPEFRGDFHFLSNMFLCSVAVDYVPYSSSEHAYQSFKCLYPEDAEDVRHAVSGYAAKRIANNRTRKPYWEDVKLCFMLKVLRAKFQGRWLREKLIATGNRYLVEHNTWYDQYWGVYNGVGQNHLGQLLMQVREECRP